ncbi:TetR/AcrR family transcriptional regulator [Agromyces sp. NPDC058484]|uniref:TetR/AcrR family transcriptional regulator n=1 Tax=Agromyces sp. NPDC058484 TaxID=3346524 RepID=UPI003656D039
MAGVRTTEALWHGTAQHTRDAARRRRLLDAALELYGTIGFRATTVQALCRLATVSTRSFYELYADQERLLEQLYRELNDEVLAGFALAVVEPGVGLAVSLRRLVAASLEPMLLDERKARVLEIESVGVSAELEAQRRTAYRTFAVAIDAACEEFVRAGLIGEAPAGLASLILVGGITEALVQRVQTDVSSREPDAAFIDAIAAVILRVIGGPD